MINGIAPGVLSAGIIKKIFKMKIIFVGMFNKPGKLPLDSSTKSGRAIDDIAKQLQAECVKTNLFDTEYYPKDDNENFGRATIWWQRVRVDEKDIIVLLGNLVQKDFVNCPLHKKIIGLDHPAGRRHNMNEYISCAVAKIKNYCT
jgi:hypothetical protein